MKKKNVITENYLEKTPVRNPDISWSTSDDGMITLEIKNTGVFCLVSRDVYYCFFKINTVTKCCAIE